VNKTKIKIGDLVDISAGLYSKTHAGGDMFYLMARDYDHTYKLKTNLEPGITQNEKTSKHILNKGDILFASKGHNFFAAVYNEEVKPAIASSVFLVLRPNKNINQNYLAWYFNHPETQKTLTGISKGSTIPSLSKKTLSEMIISLPGLELQEKIVEFEELRNKESEIKTRLINLQNELIDHQLLNIIK